MPSETDRKRLHLFESLFVRYGAGSHLFQRFTRLKAWNTIAWTLIAIGILTWAGAFWFSSTYTN